MLDGMRSVVSFLTVLPAGGSGLGAAARGMHAFPVAGLAVGLAAGALALVLSWAGADPLVAGLLVAGFLALATGLHHADGLADLADGLMAGGGRARRLAAMRDRSTGSAGAAAVALCYAGLVAALAAAGGAHVLAAVAVAEVSAKLSMVLVASLGRPAAPGSGAAFVAAMRDRRRLAAALALSAAPALALAGPAGLAMLAAGAAVAALLALAASRAFGGVTGDVMGAANELARLAALLAAAQA